MTVTGDAELIRVLQTAPKLATKALAMGLHKEARDIMNHSKRDYVPIDNGILRASAVVGRPEIHGTTIRVQFGYGGAAKAYAIVQHEDTSLSHPPKNPRRTGTRSSKRPGRAHYLSQAVADMAPQMGARLAVSVQSMFASLGKS